MLFDKTDDVVVLVRRRLEAALAIGSNDELVTVYASASTVQTYIRRVAQAIPPIERIACIYQYFLNIQALFEIVVSEFCHVILNLFTLYFYRPSPTPCIPALTPASKAREAMSCGESTPGLK